VHLNDEAMQLRLMDEFGIARAVVFWGRLSDNDSILDAAARHPERFIPFASISPERTAYRGQWQGDDPAIVARLEALLATRRFRGIGEISVVHAATPGFAATDFDPLGPTMAGIMGLARRHRLPVLIHCEASRLGGFERMLAAFADVQVIWAHGGYTNAAQARELLGRHANLYYELSARTWPRHPRSADYPIVTPEGVLHPEWRSLIESMPGRFLVGTDASHHAESRERMKVESVRNFLLQLSPGTRAEVSANVLRRLLGEAAAGL